MSQEFDQCWQGRIDAEDGDQGLRCHQVVRPFDASSQPGVTLVGLASDLGVQYNQGRPGAKQGPMAIRKAMASMAWHSDKPLHDAGDIVVAAESNVDVLAQGQQQYAQQVAQALTQQQFVIGLGGGHEIGWASYQGCRQYLDDQHHTSAKVGILNFDAHFDLRKPALGAHWAGSSGTPFYQVSQDCAQRGLAFKYACLGISEAANTQALFNFAQQKNVSYVLDVDCSTEANQALINKFLADIDYLYVTICLDVLPAATAPGVSAPSALGLPLKQMLVALKDIQQQCQQHNVRWLMADIAELNPDFDIDQRTAKVAARLVYELMKLQNKGSA